MASGMLHQELKSGGWWLREARTWMQSNVPEGDTLTWGSHNLVTLPFYKLEELALRAAIGALAEHLEKEKVEKERTDTPTAKGGKSPTDGMNLQERILHVGGRNNDAGYVEFGSVQAVRALILQVVRDLAPVRNSKPELVFSLENQGNPRSKDPESPSDTNVSGLVSTVEDNADLIAELKSLSVTNILLDIQPGEDGMGQEIFAKSVKDVEDKLTEISQRLEDWELGIKIHPSADYKIEKLQDEIESMKLSTPQENPSPDLGMADVWHEGSKSFYRARLVTKITPEEALDEPDTSPPKKEECTNEDEFNCKYCNKTNSCPILTDTDAPEVVPLPITLMKNELTTGGGCELSLEEQLILSKISNEELLDALKHVTVHLVAAHSLLYRGGKKAAGSDVMFNRMLKDYERSANLGREAYMKHRPGKVVQNPQDTKNPDPTPVKSRNRPTKENNDRLQETPTHRE